MANDQPAQPALPTEEDAIRDSFRTSIDDAIDILEKIGPLCSDIDELVGMLRLALKNESQLSLIIQHCSPKRMRR